jgi:mannose/fructose/N-acetylgalactosamine-specific phosphotransferase system component IIC
MLAAIGHALMMSFTMTWEILWTLILGFWLSAIIQAVVSKEEMSLKTIIGFDGLADISFL